MSVRRSGVSDHGSEASEVEQKALLSSQACMQAGERGCPSGGQMSFQVTSQCVLAVGQPGGTMAMRPQRSRALLGTDRVREGARLGGPVRSERREVCQNLAAPGLRGLGAGETDSEVPFSLKSKPYTSAASICRGEYARYMRGEG